MASPTDEELTAKVRELVPTVDLETTGVKKFTKLLSKRFGGVDLKPRSDLIRAALEVAINELEPDEEEDEEEEESDDEEVEREERPAKRIKTGDGAPKRNNGLTAKKKISEKLANFLGRGDEMARTEIVKCTWDYIKENDLQNPDNKKEILLDDAMQEVFGAKVLDMFTLQKYLSAHIYPFKPVDLTKRPATNKKKPKGKDKKRKAKKVGMQPPYRLSDCLAEVVNKDILPRPQVVSAIWVYIKANELQNPDNKREIICDEKLKAVMGKKKVTMFEMNRLISNHLIEKLDKSAYQHEEGEEDQANGDEE